MSAFAQDLLTPAELSDFRRTATHAEVMGLCRRLADASPHIELTSLGTSTEGRELPLLILSRPAVRTPQEARARDRLVVLAIGNIHAGEVDGKEALPILAREIAEDPAHPLLDELIILLAPVYNADGNERVAPDNRPGQLGPEEGMGVRHNAAGLDLNRDFIKVEAAETRALLELYEAWDPAVVIDTHTTNGTAHQYTISYAGPKNPAGDARIVDFVRERMFPEVSRRLEQTSSIHSFYYGNFDDAQTRWLDFPGEGRYGTTYCGLRNRIGILSEAYAYASFRDRVLATRDFVRTCFEFTAAQRRDIRELLDSADRDTIAAGRDPRPDDQVSVRCRATAWPDKVHILSFEDAPHDRPPEATSKARTYEVEHHNRFVPELTVPRPFAYLLPSAPAAAVEVLQRHGLEVQTLREDVELDVEVYEVRHIERQEQAFQSHHLVSLQTTLRPAPRRVPAGTAVVRTAQRLGALAVYLLEPQSEDGLCTWNFFDDSLSAGGEFAVWRLPRPAPLLTAARTARHRLPPVPRPITFEEVHGANRLDIQGTAISGLTWLDDGEHFLHRREGRLYRVEARSGRAAALYDPQALATALEALPEIEDQDARRLADGRLRMDPQRRAALVAHDQDLFHVRLDGSSAVRLTRTPQDEEEFPTFSPDGRQVAFVRGDNLCVVGIDGQNEKALTNEHVAGVRNGKTDWVYFEEVFGRRWEALWWSPDSTALAFLRFDDRPVDSFALVHSDGEPQRVETASYPKAGRPNPLVTLGIAELPAGTSRLIELADYDPADLLLTRVGWWPDSAAVYVYVQDRRQTWLDLCRVQRGDGRATKLLRDSTPAWVEPQDRPYFLEDGAFLWISEKSGQAQVYRHAADGTLLNAVTAGPGVVREIAAVDEDRAHLFFVGDRDNPGGRDLYRVGLDGSGQTRLTFEPGSHAVQVAPDSRFFIDTFSRIDSPPRVVLRAADGQLIRTLDLNPIAALDEYRVRPPELFTIRAADNTELQASLLKPPDFDPRRRYPAWFMTYGGPQSPTVSDSWGGQRLQDQLLAEAGLVVFRCDPRSASGRGAADAWTSYRRLGEGELADVRSAIEWLKSHPWIDGSRIGMSGHSYGGFLTAYCMTHSDLFAAGIAGSPVTDWRLYDTIYTERYMGTPQDNPEGYDSTSVIQAAAQLHGRLLLVHGGLDDNVHLENTLRLAEALQEAGKQFELMIYPDARHGLGGRHFQQLQLDFIRRTMAVAE
jgi:dipeptidyl aminopeptidase/acylaminoacyl peptidase